MRVTHHICPPPAHRSPSLSVLDSLRACSLVHAACAWLPPLVWLRAHLGWGGQGCVLRQRLHCEHISHLVSLGGHVAVPASSSQIVLPCTSVYMFGCGHTASSGDAGSWSLGVSHCCTSSAPPCGHCPLGWWELVPRETPAEAQLSRSMPQPHGRAWPSAWHGGSAPGCLSDLRVAREG